MLSKTSYLLKGNKRWFILEPNMNDYNTPKSLRFPQITYYTVEVVMGDFVKRKTLTKGFT